jgi:molybdate transport system substrate-binding protein
MAIHLRLISIAVLLAGIASTSACTDREAPRQPESVAITQVADPVLVAVASNAAPAIEAFAREFGAKTGVSVEIAVGSTGLLAAQILADAPFHIFIAADTSYSRRLVEEGRVSPTMRRVWGRGRLALVARDARALGGTDSADALIDWIANPDHGLTWANPRTAPYGAAALEVLARAGRNSDGAPIAENVGQVERFVRSGAVDGGFMALSQAIALPEDRWRLIPKSWHQPLVHDAVLLQRAEAHEGAIALFEALTAEEAWAHFSRFGYERP